MLEFSESAIKQLIVKFPDVDEQTVRMYLDKFEKYKNGIEKKDPFQYKSFEELEQAVDAAESKATFKNKKAPQQDTETTVNKDDIVVYDENVTIYKGDSQDKCILYGRGYTFCISRQAGGNMYFNYRSSKDSTFYFIYFKKKPRTANDHIMVLDHTKHGYEWTFENNDTKKVSGGWDEIVQKYPELKDYKDLLSNKKLDDTERAEIKNIKEFIKNPTLKKFKTFDYTTKAKALKSGSNIPDDVFKTLDSTLMNEFLSVGPNLTPYQADSLKENQLKWYLKNRNIQAEQLITNNIYKFNKHDEVIPFIKKKIDEAVKAAETRISEYINGKTRSIDLSHLFLLKLPDNIPNIVRGAFFCFNTKITSLEGAPKVVGGNFNCTYTQITSLQGAPEQVGGDFNCSGTKIISLEGAPERVGGEFNCSGTKIISLEGAPEQVGGEFNCSGTKIISLEGAPEQVGGHFYCNDNPKLISFQGAPERIGGYFICDDNLTSLQGEPPTHDGDLNTYKRGQKFGEALRDEIQKSIAGEKSTVSESKSYKYTQLELLENLRDWFKPHVDKKGKKFKGWINCKTGGPCGRKNTSKGSYPACRPTKAQCKNIKGKMYKKKSSKRVNWEKKSDK